MSLAYTGNPALAAATITIPSDGDVKAAATVTVALASLADRTQAWFAGGTFAPAAPVVIQGSGMSFSGSATLRFLHGNLTFNSSSTVDGGSSEWDGTYLFQSTSEISTEGTIDVLAGALVRVRNAATLQLDAGSTFYHHGTGLFRISATTNVEIDGDWPVTGNLIVGGDADITGNVTCDDATLSGSLGVAGSSLFTGTIQATEEVRLTGDGHIVERDTQLTDADALTLSIADGDYFSAKGLTYTATRVARFKNTGARRGCKIEINMQGATMAGHFLNVQRDDGTLIAGMSNASGETTWLIIRHDGTNWYASISMVEA